MGCSEREDIEKLVWCQWDIFVRMKVEQIAERNLGQKRT
jgi:hypothetical protein